MVKIIPITDLQSKAKKYVDQVRLTEEPVVITQRGRAAAILVNYERYEGHMATLEAMSDPEWEKRLARARLEGKSKKGIALEEYVRKRAKAARSRAA